jgi:hypothetical protein
MDRNKVECKIPQMGNWSSCKDFLRDEIELYNCTYYRSDIDFLNGICLLNEIREFNRKEDERIRLEDELFEI